MAEPAEKIKITDAALEFIKRKYKKFKVGAEIEWKAFHDGSTVPGAAGPDLPQDVKETMEELKQAGVVLRNGGRYYKTTIVVPEANLEGGGKGRAPKKTHKTMARSDKGELPLHLHRQTGRMYELPRAWLPLDRTKVTQFIQATTSTQQREFEKTKQDGLSDVEVSKAIKGLKGEALFAKMRELEDRHNETFQDHIIRQFGIHFFDILGIPETGPDSPDPKR